MTHTLPPGWEEKTLGEVCEIERGGSPRPIKSYLTTAPNGLNWIKIGDTSPNSKYIYSVKEKIRPEGLAKSRWVQEGDFLLSNSMSFGRPYILKTNGCIHDGWLVLKQYQSNLQCDFLYYLLSSPFVQKQFQQSAQGSTVRNLNTQRVAKIIVPIPPLPEQKRIVEKLDKIFAAIDKAKSQTEKNLQNAKDIFNNALHHTFFDLIQKSELMKLRDLLDITSSKRIFKHEYVEEGVPFYRTKEIKELAHGRSITLELFISRDKYQQIKEKFGVPQKNDLLVSAVGTIGEIYIVPDMNPFYFKDGNILWLKNYKRPILANYLKYALCSYISQIQALAKGTAYNALTIEKLADYRVPYINIDLQQNLILHLDTVYTKTQELEKIYTQKLADLEELKQAVLQQAFSGKL